MHKKLSPKQARWQDFLVEFDYCLQYKPDKANMMADALNRGVELVSIAMSTKRSDLFGRIREGMQHDPLAKLVNKNKMRRFWIKMRCS